MKNILEKIGLKNSSVSAQVIDGHLVLSLPHAQSPVMWRMALDKIGTASFEVKENAKHTQSDLILKPKKGTGEIIASFNTKDEAVEALITASNALQHQHPSQGNAHSTERTSTKTEKQKWVLALIGAFIVIGLYYYLMTLIPENAVDIATINQASTTTSAPASESTGVPVSADDYFNGLQ